MPYFFDRVDKLEEQYHEYIKDNKTHDKNDLIQTTKKLFGKVTKLMKCAERKAGPIPYKDGFLDSPQLRQAACKVIQMKKYLRLVSLGIIENEEEDRQEVIDDLKQAQLDL